MFGKTKSLFLIVASMLCMASCDSISEDLPRCELWLEFVFDYNMEYADAFNPQVKSVDVLVFDSDDKLLFTKSAKVAALVGGNRMSLTDELDFGSYKVLTVGSLSDRFRLSDNAGNKLVPGTTTLQQVIVSLKREMGVVNFEFQHLYFGEVVEVDHLPSNTNHKIYPVNLIRDTNRFNLALMGYEENKSLYDIYRGILCNNQSFQLGKQAQVEYRFDCPEYAELKEKYHLNEIAGNGTELEHSVRLLKYLATNLTHSAWYDNSVPCNGLALLEYSLEQPEHGINCLNKSKILEECCLALGIYARRVRMLPYSPFDSDCHVVTEIFDRTLGKWCMLDPTTNGYLVDETGSVLSLLEARERMAQAGFVTFCRADETVQDLHEVAQKEMEWSAYFAKNLFRLQIDAVSQFGELDVNPEHFLVRQWSKAKAEYRITMAPEYAKTENGFEMAKMLPLFQKAVKEAETMQEPESISVRCIAEAPQ